MKCAEARTEQNTLITTANNRALFSLAKTVREALLDGDTANNEQQTLLHTYKKEFSWINQLLFDSKFTQKKTNKKRHLFLIK